jgi:hypothetical protein
LALKQEKICKITHVAEIGIGDVVMEEEMHHHQMIFRNN